MSNTQFCFTKLSPKLVVVCLVHLRGLFLSEAIGSTGESLWLLRLSSNNSSTLSLFFLSARCVIYKTPLKCVADVWHLKWVLLLLASLVNITEPRLQSCLLCESFFMFEIQMEWNKKDFLLWSIRKNLHFIWTKPLSERLVFKPFSLRSSQFHNYYIIYIYKSLIHWFFLSCLYIFLHYFLLHLFKNMSKTLSYLCLSAYRYQSSPRPSPLDFTEILHSGPDHDW